LNEQRDLNEAEPLFEHIAHAKSDPEMVKLAVQLIDRQTSEYDPADLEDRYETRLRAMLDAKIQGEDVQEAAPAPVTGNVIDGVSAGMAMSCRTAVPHIRRRPTGSSIQRSGPFCPGAERSSIGTCAGRRPPRAPASECGEQADHCRLQHRRVKADRGGFTDRLVDCRIERNDPAEEGASDGRAVRQPGPGECKGADEAAHDLRRQGGERSGQRAPGSAGIGAGELSGLEQHPTKPSRFGRIKLPAYQFGRALLPSQSAREVL
jgi:hypothetical protein